MKQNSTATVPDLNTCSAEEALLYFKRKVAYCLQKYWLVIDSSGGHVTRVMSVGPLINKLSEYRAAIENIPLVKDKNNLHDIRIFLYKLEQDIDLLYLLQLNVPAAMDNAVKFKCLEDDTVSGHVAFLLGKILNEE